MPAFTRQFSASVGWRNQAVMNTSVTSARFSAVVLANLKVDGNVLYAFWQVMVVAGNAGDRPALCRDQMLGQMAANNAGNTGDQRVAIH
jgi:hypothetical protein